MIITASEITGGRWFAHHLMNERENDHVELHDVRGLAAEDVFEADAEIRAQAAGTRAKNPFFSAVFNPVNGDNPSYTEYEDYIARVENELELGDQPRVVMFHEKNGDRHAHVVWSRIHENDEGQLRAKNLPYYKKRIQGISKDLYLERGHELPDGYKDQTQRDPLNFTRDEWQQADRLGNDPKAIRGLVQESWKLSDDRKSFESALASNGLYLARGDRRGYVVVDYRGETHSLTRMMDLKRSEAKDMKAQIGDRLGPLEHLPTVDQSRELIGSRMTGVLNERLDELKSQQRAEYEPWNQDKAAIKAGQVQNRADLAQQHEEEFQQHEQARAELFRRGAFGLWDRVTGRHARTARAIAESRQEQESAQLAQRQELIDQQLEERRQLQANISLMQERHIREQQGLDREVAFYLSMDKESVRQTLEKHTDELDLRKAAYQAQRDKNAAQRASTPEKEDFKKAVGETPYSAPEIEPDKIKEPAPAAEFDAVTDAQTEAQTEAVTEAVTSSEPEPEKSAQEQKEEWLAARKERVREERKDKSQERDGPDIEID